MGCSGSAASTAQKRCRVGENSAKITVSSMSPARFGQGWAAPYDGMSSRSATRTASRASSGPTRNSPGWRPRYEETEARHVVKESMDNTRCQARCGPRVPALPTHPDSRMRLESSASGPSAREAPERTITPAGSTFRLPARLDYDLLKLAGLCADSTPSVRKLVSDIRNKDMMPHDLLPTRPPCGGMMPHGSDSV